MSPETFKKLYFGSGPPLPQTSMVYIFLDIEHWTQSLRMYCIDTGATAFMFNPHPRLQKTYKFTMKYS